MNGSCTAWLNRWLKVILIGGTFGLFVFAGLIPQIDPGFFEFKTFQLLKLWLGTSLLIVYFCILILARDEIRACKQKGEPVELVLAVVSSFFFVGFCTLLIFFVLRSIYQNF